MRKLFVIIPAVGLALCSVPALAQGGDVSVVVVPNPVGIPEVILVVALLTFAIIKKGWIRMMLAVCIVIWGAFFVSYDIKMAAPCLAVGAVLFIQALLTQIQAAREATE